MSDIRQQPPFGLFSGEPDVHGNVTRSPAVLPTTTVYTPPHNGTPTSHAAAIDLSAGKADRDRHAITMYLWRTPHGATRAEIEDATGIHGDALRPRLKELMGEMRTYIGEAVVCRLIDSDGKPVTRIYGTHKAAEVLVHRTFAARL